MFSCVNWSGRELNDISSFQLSKGIPGSWLNIFAAQVVLILYRCEVEIEGKGKRKEMLCL